MGRVDQLRGCHAHPMIDPKSAPTSPQTRPPDRPRTDPKPTPFPRPRIDHKPDPQIDHKPCPPTRPSRVAAILPRIPGALEIGPKTWARIGQTSVEIGVWGRSVGSGDGRSGGIRARVRRRLWGRIRCPIKEPSERHPGARSAAVDPGSSMDASGGHLGATWGPALARRMACGTQAWRPTSGPVLKLRGSGWRANDGPLRKRGAAHEVRHTGGDTSSLPPLWRLGAATNCVAPIGLWAIRGDPKRSRGHLLGTPKGPSLGHPGGPLGARVRGRSGGHLPMWAIQGRSVRKPGAIYGRSWGQIWRRAPKMSSSRRAAPRGLSGPDFLPNF